MNPRLIAAGLCLALAFLAGWSINGWKLKGEIAEIRAEHAEAYAQANAQARSEEARRAAAIEGIRRDAQIRIQELESDVVAAADAADRLRKELARRRGAAEHTAATGGGAPTISAVILYSELLDRADTRAGELAEFADRSRVAGEACVAAYDALTGNQHSIR